MKMIINSIIQSAKADGLSISDCTTTLFRFTGIVFLPKTLITNLSSAISGIA